MSNLIMSKRNGQASIETLSELQELSSTLYSHTSRLDNFIHVL